MRKQNNEIKKFINIEIEKNPTAWKYAKGANFGIRLQELVGKYYSIRKNEFEIKRVEINTNPNDTKPDIVLYYNDESQEGIEVKSCKDGALSGVTICNAPHLLNDKVAYLINYTVCATGIIKILQVYETQIFRLTSINKAGKYKDCLMSTRDTGKKIKGRAFNDFINSNDCDDYTFDELIAPILIRKTILYYSASKLVDDEYNFSDEEILGAIHHLRNNNKKPRSLY